MPVRVSPEDGSNKWVNRLSGATADIQAGVQRVTEAPGKKAAAKRQKWQQAIANAGDKWQRNVASVSLQDWQNYMVNVGVPRVAQGAQAKQDKYTNFAQQFYPYLNQGISKVENMPDTSLEERIQRAVAMMRHNSNFKRSGTGM